MEQQAQSPWATFLRVEMLGLIVALLVQAAGLVWWGSQITSRVSVLETKAVAASHQAEDIARIDERTKSIDEAIQRVEHRLDGQDSAR